MAFRSSGICDPACVALVLTILIFWNPVKVFLFAATFTTIYVSQLVIPSELFSLVIAAMEAKAAELVLILKNHNLAVDAKTAHLTSLKSDIKQKNVPEAAVPAIFESLRLAIASPHSSLLAAGFSTLGHFLKRLLIQDELNLIAQQSRSLLPLLVERLGDHKDRIRQQAAQAFSDLWPAASADVEHYVLEVALVGKNARAKEMSLTWLAQMHRDQGLMFRAYVPSVVACLEDADSGVRDTAKVTVIDLFQHATPRAKADLKRELVAHNVRKSITGAILSAIGLSAADLDAAPPAPRPASRADGLLARPVSRAEGLHHSRPVSAMSSRSQPRVETSAPQERAPHMTASSSSLTETKNHIEAPAQPSQARPAASKPERTRPTGLVHSSSMDALTQDKADAPQDAPKVDPLLVASAREIDDLVRQMSPAFEGRESEANWLLREKHVATLRRLTWGNAPQSYPSQYIGAIKTLLDGIFKAVNSLRTTLSTSGCVLIQDVAQRSGPKIDPMVEIILQNLIKLCGGMKKINVENGNKTVSAVIANVSYTPRILQHVTAAAQDKNVGLRLCATEWIKTLINRQAHHKASMEHGGGVDLLEKAIKKGLTDANPGVREAMRSTFWTFFKVWPQKGEEMLASLDPKSRSLLEKDPSNPTAAPSSGTGPTVTRPGLPKSASATAGRTALKEAIAARKKARLPAATAMPPRPESAQSSFPEPVAAPAKQPRAAAGPVRTVPTGQPISSLSSAPVRPAARARRPELARPATADPYASRRTPVAESRTKSTTFVPGSPKLSKTVASPTVSAGPGSSSRLRTKVDHPSQPTSTRIKPKKLDLSAVTARDPRGPVQHSRTRSNESTATSASDTTAHAELLHSPSLVRSPVSATQPATPSKSPAHRRNVVPQEFKIVADTVIDTAGIRQARAMSDPRQSPMVTPDALRYPPPHVSVPLADTGPRGEGKLDTLHIYEDPIDSATSEPDTPDVPPPEPATAHEGEGPSPVAVEMSTPVADPLPTSSAIATEEPVQKPPDIVPDTVAPGEGLEALIAASEGDEIPENTVVRWTDASPESASDSGRVPTNGSTPSAPGAHSSFTSNNENQAPLGSKGAVDTPTTVIRCTPKATTALGELHANEQAPLRFADMKHAAPEVLDSGTTTSRHRWRAVESSERRRSISPRSKDPDLARDMLAKGIQRIRSKNMDILGYRKLQGLIEYHDQIFTDEAMYDHMLLALLDELESAPDNKRQPLGRPLDLKTQVLITVRAMFRYNKLYFRAYYPRAMTALVGARRHYEATCHVVSGLDETADDIIAVCEPESVTDAVLDFILTEEMDTEGCRAISMGIAIINKMLRRLIAAKTRLPQSMIDRIGHFAARILVIAPSDLRRTVTSVCVHLHTMLQGDEALFWKSLGSPRQSIRSLLTYYIHK